MQRAVAWNARQKDARAALISRAGALLALVTLPAWMWALFFSHDFHIPMDYVVVPVVAAGGLAFVLYVTRLDPTLRQIMLSGLLLKYAAGSVYIFVVYRVYGAAADLAIYNTKGYLLANDFVAFGRWPIQDPLIGTNFVETAVAFLYSAFGPSLPGATAVYVTIAFVGQYLLYRAFCIAYEWGDKRAAALLLFLLPSILYWTSSLSKDCQALLAIGMVTYGLAFASRRTGLRGYAMMGTGLLVMFLVRPHMSGILAITCALAYLFGKTRTGLWGSVLKLMVAPALLAATFVLAQQGAEFVDVRSTSDTEAALERIAENNANAGRSSFNTTASVASRIALSPFLMFRPFPWEAHNVQAFAASAEGLFLLVFVWKQRQWFFGAVKRVRSDPFSAYAISYATVFSILFAGAMTNFGLLARQRVMMLPITLLLFVANDVRMAAEQQQTARTFAYWIRDLSSRKGGSGRRLRLRRP